MTAPELTTDIATTERHSGRRRETALVRFWRWEASGILVALVVLMVLLSLATENFLSPYTMSVVARQAAFVGLLALGQTLVLMVGGIDLSVGAVGAVSGLWPGGHVCRPRGGPVHQPDGRGATFGRRRLADGRDHRRHSGGYQFARRAGVDYRHDAGRAVAGRSGKRHGDDECLGLLGAGDCRRSRSCRRAGRLAAPHQSLIRAAGTFRSWTIWGDSRGSASFRIEYFDRVAGG